MEYSGFTKVFSFCNPPPSTFPYSVILTVHFCISSLKITFKKYSFSVPSNLKIVIVTETDLMIKRIVCVYISTNPRLSDFVFQLKDLHAWKSWNIYLFMAALVLWCCMQAFSSCGEWVTSPGVHRLLVVVASPVEEQGSRACWLQ